MQDTDKKALFIVDDVYLNRAILRNLFEDRYRILEADDGRMGIEQIENNIQNLALILLDIKMPGIDGFGVMEYMNQMDYIKDCPVILITSDEDEDAMERGYHMGATDVIKKPFVTHTVLQRVKNTLELYRYKYRLEELVDEKTKELSNQYHKLEEYHLRLVEVLNDIVDSRSVESMEHIAYVQGYTRILANHYAQIFKHARMTKQKIEYIVKAATIHDIGKITLPDTILTRPGKLSHWEMEVLKGHTVKGSQIVEVMAEFEDDEYRKICRNVCMYHHEKYDGSGYPGRIRKERIPIEAQLVGLADLYDALIHTGVQSKAVKQKDAYTLLMEGRCGELSPRMKECLMSAKEELEEFEIE